VIAGYIVSEVRGVRDRWKKPGEIDDEILMDRY
jgi:hypothetical protein